jgi:hypothetical protein
MHQTTIHALVFAPDLLKLSANFTQTTAAVQMIIRFNSGETLSDLIKSDTIIAVVAEDDESDFYLMKTVAEPEILSKNVTDDGYFFS